MSLPSAVYELSQILDEDSRFDGFVFFNEDVSPTLVKEYETFENDDPMSIHWQPREWQGDWTPLPVTGEVNPLNDYPCLNLLIPVFSHRAVDALGEILTENGLLLPFDNEVGEYFGYVGLTKIAALDLDESRLRRSNPNERSDLIEYFAFKPEKLADATIFRIPESPNNYFVTDAFKERVEQAKLNGFHFIPVWPLPEDSDWMMEETYRRRKRKKVKLVGEALILRFRLASDRPSEGERKLASELADSLRRELKSTALNHRYLGSVESTELEAGEFRIFCMCPDCEELERHLQPWLTEASWPNGIALVRRYGNLYAGRAKVRAVEVRQPTQAVDDSDWLKDKVESSRQRELKVSNKKTTTHSESELGDQMPEQIKDSAVEALSMLGLDVKEDAATIVAAVDRFVYEWQCGKRPPIDWDEEDIPYYLGSLWGEQLVRQFGWAWKTITFHEHGDSKAPGVLSADRALAIYPIHFIIGCLQDPTVDATILLSFNMLLESETTDSKAGAYDNLMAQVFRIVPRIAALNTNGS